MIIQYVVHEDSEDMANMLNVYFVDIGKNIAESIGANNNHLDYMDTFSSKKFIVSAEKIICSLKNKSSNLITIPVKS